MLLPLRPCALALALFLVAPARAAQDDVNGRAPILDHARLRRAMTRLASEHAQLVTRLELGASRRGLKIDALRLAAGELERGRPAVLVVANLEGPRLWTSGVALELARDLARGYANDARVRELLDTTTVFIVPRANPDGAEVRFKAPLRELLGTGHDVDNDRDGRVGEDHSGDVNDDGYVTRMRILDPDGEWIEDPTDPRIMVRADRAKGERGRWRIVTEGRDRDGDGEVVEDPARDAEVNRNFPAGWEEHEPRAGLFPTDEPETRALVEFVLGHENIQVVLAYGEQNTLVAKPASVPDDAPAADRVPKPGLRGADAALVAEIARRYAKITDREVEGSDDDAGSFQAWAYGHRGLLTLSLALWSVPLDDDGESDEESEPEGDQPERDEDAPKPSDDAKRLAWLERQIGSGVHLGWNAFEHPELGPLEVGGFRPYALIEPPDDVRSQIVTEQLELLTLLGPMLARVALTDVESEDLGGGLMRVRAAVENSSLLPLFTLWGRTTRVIPPARVELFLPAGAERLAGPRQTLVWDLPGAGGRQELEWLVRGAERDRVGVLVETRHAGTDRAVPEAK